MNVSVFALLKDKTKDKMKSITKGLSVVALPCLTREEQPVLETLDEESLSRYIQIQAVRTNEVQEGIQRSPSEASLFFQNPLTLESPTKGATSVTSSTTQQSTKPSKIVLKNRIRRGLLMLPGNVLLMRAAQHEDKKKIDYGVKTSSGRRPYMEDSHITKTSFLTFPISLQCSKQIIPDYVEKELSKLEVNSNGNGGSSWTDVMVEMKRPKDGNVQCVFDDFSLFLICDGHGGAQVAQHCTATFQKVLTDQLQSSVAEIQSQLMQSAQFTEPEVAYKAQRSFSVDLPERSSRSAGNLGEFGLPTVISKRPRLFRNCESFKSHLPRNDQQKVSTECTQQTPKCGLSVQHLKDGLTRSFKIMDAEVRNLKIGEYEGSTALACLVGSWHICIANCGDSRAVLSRNGVAVRLTRDHKPHVDEERTRIEQNGGFVLDTYGCSRVNGFLAVSRAIGDHLFPSVIAEPDVTIVHRHHTDEFLICATDGLWDVIPDDVACQMTKRCLARAEEKGASSKLSTRVAANVLLRAALDKGSTDNITVTVVDLRSGSKTGDNIK